MTRPVLAVDIGGTKIAAAVVAESGEVLAETKIPTPHLSADAAFGAVAEAVLAVARDHPVDAVGIGCAGPVDTREGTVSPVNIHCWRGFPLRDAVSGLFPGLPVTLAGDGICMALGEHWQGAGQGNDNLVGLVVSTGVGGGFVFDGRAHLGRTGNAGHLGHMVAQADGDPCPCGGRGCVETIASGPNLVRWARRQGWQAPPEADGAHLAAAAREGDEIPLSAFRRGGHAVGLAIAAAGVLCDLDLAVVGGGVAQAGDLLFAPIRDTIAEHSRLSFVDPITVVPAALGGRAGLIGAAALALR